MISFTKLQKDELTRARNMYGYNIANAHEGYAVILEEMDELKEEVWKKPANRDPRKLLNELVQIAAMAQRMAEDLGLLK